MRVSLTADPVEEVIFAKQLLAATGLRKESVEVVSCPTCGRTRIDLAALAKAGATLAKSQDGKALKLFNTHYEWCTQLHLDRIGYEPGQTYRVRIRVRVEKQGAGMAFSTGIYDFAKRQSVTSKALTTEKTTADYAWYEVGSVVLNDNQVLWIAPGRFDDQGASAIKAVYIDKVDFARVAP